MSTNPATRPTDTPDASAARLLASKARALRHWNRMALLSLGVILLYMAACLFLLPAPIDQPQMPGIFAGFAVAPLFALAVAYWLIRLELKQR
jgi:hypothetical protein